jgi:hypothetical protein
VAGSRHRPGRSTARKYSVTPPADFVSEREPEGEVVVVVVIDPVIVAVHVDVNPNVGVIDQP